MNTDTPTPRTKAATFNARLGNPWKDEVVYASVAETLERELTAARERIAELEAQVVGLKSTLGYLTVDVAGALQAAVNTLAAHKPV